MLVVVSERHPVPHLLPKPLVEFVAQRFRVLGEPMRIKLLDRLRDSDATVGELQEAPGVSQQNVSKHLGILHSAGMVARTKDGNRAVYSISDPSVFELRAGLRRRPPPAAGARGGSAAHLTIRGQLRSGSGATHGCETRLPPAQFAR